MNNKNQKSLMEFINCLKILELQTHLLYKNLSDKVENTLVKTLLGEIAIDSQKHSEILKGVIESIARPKGDQKECAKDNKILQGVIKFQKEIAKMQKLTSEDLLILNRRLQLLENQMGEEYCTLVQMKTLTFLGAQINQSYNIDLSNVKHIFTSIINDEERHIELLETIKKIVTPKEQEINNPLVKFQNPDGWYQSPASAS
jgi:rubrerythrin